MLMNDLWDVADFVCRYTIITQLAEKVISVKQKLYPAGSYVLCILYLNYLCE